MRGLIFFIEINGERFTFLKSSSEKPYGQMFKLEPGVVQGHNGGAGFNTEIIRKNRKVSSKPNIYLVFPRTIK